MKKGIILGLLMVLAATGSVSASSATNKKTGPKSLNVSAVVNVQATKVTTRQNALVVNNVEVEQKGGKNVIMGNTEGGSIKTGSTTARLTINNNVNTATTKVTTCDTCGTKSEAENEETGPGSVNVAAVANISLTKVTTVQNAMVINDVEVEQSNGGNAVIGNTEAGGIRTGDLTAALTINNDVNNARTVVNP